jgi:hypothetical protein
MWMYDVFYTVPQDGKRRIRRMLRFTRDYFARCFVRFLHKILRYSALHHCCCEQR